jgi:hypothetical protein
MPKTVDALGEAEARPMIATASAVERLMACAGGALLPGAGDDNEYASRGTTLHAYMEDVAALGSEAALARVPADLRAGAEAIDLSILPEAAAIIGVEVAFAWNALLDEGRELGRGTTREIYAACGPDDFAGTADLVFLADGVVTIFDWKFGRGDLPPAKRNWQLRTLALLACRAYDVDRARVAIVRIREDGTAWHDAAEFDAMDLEEISIDLSNLGERIARGRGSLRYPSDLRRGGHCRYCPSFDFCPAQHELLQIAVRRPEQLAQEAEVALTNGGRARAYEIWVELKLLTKRMGERITAHASVRPIELGEGRFYGFAPGDRKAKDPAKVKTILTAHVGAEAAAAAVAEETKAHTTIGAIEKALKALPAKQRPAVWAELLAAGAVSQPPSLGEFEGEPAAPAGSEAA